MGFLILRSCTYDWRVARKGFMAGCMPIIGLDACHLKTKSSGQLITAVARDPSEEYFPLTYAIVEAETKDSWTWFIKFLLIDIGQNTRWTFVLDQQKICIFITISICITTLDV